MRFGRRLALLALVIVLLGSVAGCKKNTGGTTLTPKVAPPVIGKAGVLRAGVDLAYPPFAGTDKGVKAGIDIDVAAAVAEKLGLRLEIVSVDTTGAAAALANGKIDIMLGATPITDAVLTDVSSAGSYMVDGPAFFTKQVGGSAVATMTAADLPGKRVGVQRDSQSYLRLVTAYGEAFVTPYPTLREALAALSAGEVDVVAGDAAVGAYIARDYPGIGYAGQYGDAALLGIAVKKDAIDLEGAVRSVLDGLAADGTLDAIRSRWLGTIPKLETPTSGLNG